MYHRIIYVSIITLLIFQNGADGKKQRNKLATEIENPAPQPNVLTYSTFGFNDVRSYDGFVPTSPDYANYFNKYKETSEKLYAPAFPSAPDSDFTSNSQTVNEDPFTASDTEQQPSMLHYNTANIYASNFQSEDKLNTNSASDTDFEQSSVNNNNSPVYGTKISSTNKNLPLNGYNNTAINSVSYQNDNKYSNFQETQPSDNNRQVYSGSVNNIQKNMNYGTTDYPTIDIDNSMNVAPAHSQSLLKFPKVLDFTDTKPYDTLETEKKYYSGISNPLDTFDSMANSASDDTQKFYEEQNNKMSRISPNFKNVMENKETDINISQPNLNSYQDFTNKFYNAKSSKNKKLNYEYKDEMKGKPWKSEAINTDKKRLKIMKGYDYSSNISSSKFKFDAGEPKKQFASNTDEFISSSSNNIDFSNYQFPQNDYTKLNTRPVNKNVNNVYEDNESSQNVDNKYNPSLEYLNKFNNLYGSTPTTSTNWGNIYKTTDYKTHISKPTYREEETYDTIHIPKRPNHHRYEKNSDNAAIDWSAFTKKQSKFTTPKSEWNKENYNTRFKSEEDLLGLRNHDTSHPSYLPIFQYNANENSEENFKSAVEKWREDYIKSKYRDTPNYEYEASEAKHVQAVNPYQIEVPHPVIVPVPQPYPVQVPIPKPVAVPVIHEINVPIEKPIPYPVYKKTPYPVEKLVPVPVVKQVPVPVVKPYAVPVPQMRPVYHQSRPYRDEHDFGGDNEDFDDYFPRPESSNVVYNKRPKSSRNRLRRPSRMSHQERSKGRRPLRRPNTSRERDQHHYIKPTSDHHRFRYHDSDSDEERDYSEYLLYCKRTGKC